MVQDSVAVQVPFLDRLPVWWGATAWWTVAILATGGVVWLVRRSRRRQRERNEAGEMPFLDHLEELRWRILWSVSAILIGSIIGYYVVQRFDLVTLLKTPIDKHLTDGRLVFTRPTDAFLIRIKLSVLVGTVLAFPVVLNQIWKFLAPALYEHEKRHVMPLLIAGTGLFIAGAWMAFLWILPAALSIMLSDVFLGGGLEPLITAGEYFSFATSLILAFAFVFELPLVMVLLATFGLVSPQFFARHRQYAVLAGAIIAAFVTPPDAFTMIMMMIPILVLYEVGIAIGRIVWKQRHSDTIGG